MPQISFAEKDKFLGWLEENKDKVLPVVLENTEVCFTLEKDEEIKIRAARNLIKRIYLGEISLDNVKTMTQEMKPLARRNTPIRLNE